MATALAGLAALAAVMLAPRAQAAGSSTAPATPAGAIGIRLLDAPVARADDPRAHSYIVDSLAPGTTIERHVEVSNTTGTSQRISVYPAAAQVDADGFDVMPGRTGNDLSSWVDLEPGVLDLPPHSVGEATVTVRVPARATAGERYGVVWAEPAPPPHPDGSVVVVNRVGIRLYLAIGPGGEPPTDFAISAVGAGRGADGLPYVAATVTNTAVRALDMIGTLRLTDGPAGLSAPTVNVPAARTIGRGASARLLIPVPPGLPLGPWTAHLSLSSGLVHHSAKVRLTFPAAPGENRGRHLGRSVLVGSLAAGGGAAVALAAAGVAAHRRRARHRAGRTRS